MCISEKSLLFSSDYLIHTKGFSKKIWYMANISWLSMFIVSVPIEALMVGDIVNFWSMTD